MMELILETCVTGAMFPFVIQMNEVVMERELKLRQALQAMGLHDTSYWLSWHMYQSGMALLFGFFIWVFGMIFQLRIFLKNGTNIIDFLEIDTNATVCVLILKYLRVQILEWCF
jgi:hypothetical protein